MAKPTPQSSKPTSAPAAPPAADQGFEVTDMKAEAGTPVAPPAEAPAAPAAPAAPEKLPRWIAVFADLVNPLTCQRFGHQQITPAAEDKWIRVQKAAGKLRADE